MGTTTHSTSLQSIPTDTPSRGIRFSASSKLPDPPERPSCKISREDYLREIVSVQGALSYPLSRGKYNPYSGRSIETLQDYEFYCQCIALRRLYDERMSAAFAVVDSTQNVLSAADAVVNESRARASAAQQEAALAKREAALYKHDAMIAKSDYAALKARVESGKKLRLRILIISVILFLGFLLFYPFSRPQENVSQSTESSHVSSSSSSSSEPTGDGPERPSGYVSNEYIANKKSHKFHRSSCSYLPDEDNQRIFKSRNAAISAGYDPCEHCNP